MSKLASSHTTCIISTNSVGKFPLLPIWEPYKPLQQFVAWCSNMVLIKQKSWFRKPGEEQSCFNTCWKYSIKCCDDEIKKAHTERNASWIISLSHSLFGYNHCSWVLHHIKQEKMSFKLPCFHFKMLSLCRYGLNLSSGIRLFLKGIWIKTDTLKWFKRTIKEFCKPYKVPWENSTHAGISAREKSWNYSVKGIPW